MQFGVRDGKQEVKGKGAWVLGLDMSDLESEV